MRRRLRTCFVVLALVAALPLVAGARGCSDAGGRTPQPAPADPAPQRTGGGQHHLFWRVDSVSTPSARNVGVIVKVTKNGNPVERQLFRRPPQEGFVNYEDGDVVELTVEGLLRRQTPGSTINCTIEQDDNLVTGDQAVANADGDADVVCFWLVED